MMWLRKSPADMEIEIVHELGQEVLAQESILNATSDICGELDRYDIRIHWTSARLIVLVCWPSHKVPRHTNSAGHKLQRTMSSTSTLVGTS